MPGPARHRAHRGSPRSPAALRRPQARRAVGGDRSCDGVLAIAAAAVAVGAIALWLIGGVGAWDLIRYLGYEAVFVVGPGWLLLRALAPGIRHRGLQFALGWPIGLTLEILAFSLTAGLGIRDAFIFYPLAVGIPAALVLRRRGLTGPPAAPLFTRASRWVIAGLCLLAFAYIGISYYTITPLPGTAPGVLYTGDMTFAIAVAASALHGWPPSLLGVSDQPFNYHYFVHVHMAAIAQVTGLHLPLIVFRLYLLPLTALQVLQVALAGRLLTGREWAGPVAVALLGGLGMFSLWISPSQLLGMAFFVPILVVLATLLDPEIGRRLGSSRDGSRRGLWALLLLLMVGAGGAKVVLLPVLLGGLVVYLGWAWLRERQVDRTAAAAAAVCFALVVGYYLLLYSGGSHGLRIDPPATINSLTSLVRLHEVWPRGLPADAAYWATALPLGFAMYAGAPVIGLILWLRHRRRPGFGAAAALSVSFLLVGAGAFYFLYDDYLEETYFTAYGLVAVLPFAAAGLLELADRRVVAGPGRRWLAGFAATWVVALALLAMLANRLADRGHAVRADLLSPARLGLALALIALATLAFRGRARRTLGTYAVAAVLITVALDIPINAGYQTARKLDVGAPLYSESSAGLRPRELVGMEWVRDHLPFDSLLAVANDSTPHTRQQGPIDGDYPALTEHRTFREQWVYAGKANEFGQPDVAAGRTDPFPARTALERAVFVRGDRRAAEIMVHRYGVTHLVISKKDGAFSTRVYSLGRLVYSNGAVDVIELPST